MARAALALFPLLLLTASLSGCLVESQWALEVTGIKALHDRGLTGAGVKVAVIDTGIDPEHPEFQGLSVVWRDFVNGRPRPYDDSAVGHGTHVAGIIVAQGSLTHELLNGVQLKGAAPGVDLIIAKAVGGNGEGTDSNVAAAVRFAVGQGAHVIVMSLGGRPGSILFGGNEHEQAVRDALGRGIVVVAAAGNRVDGQQDGTDVASPASIDGVIAVGAVDRDKRLADFSYRGNDGCIEQILGRVGCRQDPNKKPEILAPGVQILSAARDQRYAIADGTSQATPFVGAAVALILEAKPEYKAGGARGGSQDAVRAIKLALAQGAEKIGPLAGMGGLSHDQGHGYGLLRADQALARL